MTLNGWDIAGVNGAGAITRALSEDFAIFKASEGQTFKDPEHDYFIGKARAEGGGCGHYHYARPDTKDNTPPIDPIAEAEWFVHCSAPQAGERMLLDFEKNEPIELRGDWPEWIIAFVSRVNVLCGGLTGVYYNDWFAYQVLKYATDAQKATLRSYPLWKAGKGGVYVSSPAVGIGDIFGWPAWDAWQWTDSPLDRDVFNGDMARWKRLGKGGLLPSPSPTPLPAPSDGGPTGAFPLPRGHYYCTPRPDIYCHSGFWNTADRPAIRAIQREVGATADGFFGSVTLTKVKAWQAHYGLITDGKVGPLTWSKMTLK